MDTSRHDNRSPRRPGRPGRPLRLALAATLLGAILTAWPQAALAQRGKNAFNTVFDENAVGRHDGNAYLLTYLVTLIFPENLDLMSSSSRGRRVDPGYVVDLHKNPERFLAEYRKATEHLFHDPEAPASAKNARPQYAFIRGSGAPGLKGYDPEAMIISMPTALIVVIRGTDVVAQRTGTGSNLPEWIESDIFKFFAKTPDVPGLAGKVHEGFWYSVTAPAVFWAEGAPDGGVRTYRVSGGSKDNEFRERVYQQIVRFGGASKKLWIVGHSLGAAQAQVMAAWLDARVNTQGQRQGIRAQGVYAVAAPHVGDKDFVENLDRRFREGKRLQRFDFVDDPVTLLPMYAVGYQRAGTRVYYDDIKTIQFDVPERFITDDAKLGQALVGTLSGASVSWMTDGNKYVKLRAASTLFCFHHPQWYLNAAYAALNRTQRARVPAPLGVPTIDDFFKPCGPLDIARGRRNPVAAGTEMVADGIDAAKDAIETVAYNAGQLLDNATGSAIAEGTYFIRAVKGGKFLDVSGSCVNTDGCKVQLWDLGKREGNNTFVVKKQGLGYTIRNGSKHFVEVDADDLFDNGARIQVWKPNMPFDGHAPNQVWYFYKVPNKTNRYIIRNEASGKVLDAVDSCTSQNGCKVQQWTPRDSDASQVWIVEKAD